MATYSFIDVYATLVDPVTGASIRIGSGAGVTEEGISVVQINNIGNIHVGADAQVMQVLQASRAARLTVRLLKTSPVNAQLMILAEVQRTSGALWGRNTFSLTNIATFDEVSGSQCAFEKIPDNTYDKPGKMFEWIFLVGNATQLLGVQV